MRRAGTRCELPGPAGRGAAIPGTGRSVFAGLLRSGLSRSLVLLAVFLAGPTRLLVRAAAHDRVLVDELEERLRLHGLGVRQVPVRVRAVGAEGPVRMLRETSYALSRHVLRFPEAHQQVCRGGEGDEGWDGVQGSGVGLPQSALHGSGGPGAAREHRQQVGLPSTAFLASVGGSRPAVFAVRRRGSGPRSSHRRAVSAAQGGNGIAAPSSPVPF